VDLTQHIESTVAVDFELSTELDALAGRDCSAPDSELDLAVAPDQHVAVGDDVVFLDGRAVGNREFVERVAGR
jgi:hypothetical protein